MRLDLQSDEGGAIAETQLIKLLWLRFPPETCIYFRSLFLVIK